MEWIKLSDKLPEYENKVLFYSGDIDYKVGKIIEGSDGPWDDLLDLPYYTTKVKDVSNCYWCELPKPPKD